MIFLIDYVSKNCNVWVQKNKNNIKRESCTQIITYYPKQRFVIDITELPEELNETKKKNYLFNIIDHFTKFGISFLINNKESKNILKFLQITLECYGIPDEIKSNNITEFKNHLIESFLNEI